MTGAVPVHSYVEQATGDLIVSAIKTAESGSALIVRLWNATDEPRSETLTLWRPVKAASLVALNEEPALGGSLRISGAAITVEAKPHQIVTVRVEVA